MYPFPIAANSSNCRLADALRSFTLLCGLMALMFWAGPFFFSPLLHPIPPPMVAVPLPQESGPEPEFEAVSNTESVSDQKPGMPDTSISPVAANVSTVPMDEAAPLEPDGASASVLASDPAPGSTSLDITQVSSADGVSTPSPTAPPEIALTEEPPPPVRIPVLNYHSITVDPGNPATITPEKFLQQMTYLKENGYTALRLEQFTDLLEGKQPLGGKPVLLTFDDGYADNYVHALPILKELGFHATLFVSPGTAEDGYFLNWDQIKEMHKAGWDIQPHGMTHPHLPRLTEEEQIYQITEARRQIEEQLGTTADIFCYPYGEWNAATLKVLHENQFRYAFTIMQAGGSEAYPGVCEWRGVVEAVDIQIRKMIVQSETSVFLAKKRWTPIAIYFVLVI